MVKKTFLLVLSIIVFLSACSPTAPQTPISNPVLTPLPTEPGAEVYPYPLPQGQVIPTPPYPLDTPQRPDDAPFVVPTPDANTGVLFGQIVDNVTGLPLVDQSIYLGEKIMFTPGPGYSIGVQEKSSPHTLTNGSGQFAISGITPGTYLLMVWTPFATSVLLDPQTADVYEVTLAAGQALDVGTVKAIDPTKK